MDKRKEREVLTKCRGGGGEERTDAGLQVINLGIFRVSSQISPPSSLLFSRVFFGLFSASRFLY